MAQKLLANYNMIVLQFKMYKSKYFYNLDKGNNISNNRNITIVQKKLNIIQNGQTKLYSTEKNVVLQDK